MYWENWAYVYDNTVKWVGSFSPGGYTEATMGAKGAYGPNAFAVDVTLYPVSVGFKFIDGIFYDFDNNPVERIKTVEEITMRNQNDITDLQLAITTLYEASLYSN